MLSETLDFYSKGSRAMVNLVAQRISQQFYALGHRWTYREVAKPKNVIVLGGSYAGVYLAQRLTETLPTGYRAVLVERNTHFHHLFVFPRFAVVRGHEEKAFIPFHGIAKSAPVGIFQHICDTVTGVQPHQVQLASGSVLDYEYLAIATGSWQPSPVKVVSTTKNGGAAELRDCQDRISRAGRIAVIGGGPVGVQLASDIKSYYPQKDVTLVHSRMLLLPAFGPRLHGYAVDGLTRLNVRMVLGERPQIERGVGESAKDSLQFKDGNKKYYDLVIPCTGQRPNCGILAKLAPAAICKDTRQILVQPTLQIDAGDKTAYPQIFALGDVAKTDGPRMARAARSQAEVVLSNILYMIHAEKLATEYRPTEEDGVIKLTMGKNDWVMHVRDKERELIVAGNNQKEELDVARAWQNLGARVSSDWE